MSPIELVNLKPPLGAKKKRKRIGCGPGSGHGKTSCRGHKGSGQRKGKEFDARYEGGQMPFYRRIPKRGFYNFTKTQFELVKVGDLDKFPAKSMVNADSLAEAGLVKKGYRIKVLGDGEIGKSLNVFVHAFSKSAKAKIEKAGGTTKIIEEIRIKK